jgi:hypothetical protein
MILVCLPGLVGLSASARGAEPEQVLFDFEGDFDTAAVELRDARISLSKTDGGRSLRVATGHEATWPGITLKAPGGHWDLSSFSHLTLEVRNAGTSQVDVFCRIDTPEGDGRPRQYFQESVGLGPGETKTFRVAFRRTMPEELAESLFGMRGFPGGYVKDQGIDPADVDQLLIFVSRPSEDHVFEIERIAAGGSHNPADTLPVDPQRLFPMIDRFGQYVHKDWPGKTHSVEDLEKRKKDEAADLAAQPGPQDWNRYGGWQAGPQREATGHFRAEKQGGKWWLVDPDGRLFWSHGSDCVHWSNAGTPITDRKHWFEEMPEGDPAYAEFFGRGNWAPHGYYQGKRYQTYNFTAANLLRKYGRDWQQEFAELSHRRLRSWGMNTIANWSESRIYRMQKTPYVVTVGSGRKPIEGSEGYWGKFPDPFDPDFAGPLRERMESERDKSVGDAWCIGYFVDNELSWGDELSLAVATLASPPGQPAKTVFLEDLKAKYGAIVQLNRAWGTEHASWEALRECRTPPDREKAHDDLAAFYTRIAEEYFRNCREAIKQVAPQNLYLGCRFAWVNDRAVRAAAKYCDVISFNRYSYSVADFRLPEGIDKPAIIGEFHFGALDRGMFHTGLRAVDNQSKRAEAYTGYVQGALENPWLVGTHWFQFGDQATTGRGDGENYQIGLIDVCDTPYPETIDAVRRVGATLYRHRWEAR